MGRKGSFGDSRPSVALDAAFNRLNGGFKPAIPREERAPDLDKAAAACAERRRMKRVKAAALATQDGRCRYCRDPLTLETATIEHKLPRAKGGTDDAANIAASCSPCNWLKARRTDGEFMRLVKAPPAGSPLALHLAGARRRLNLATERACKRIMGITT